MPEILLAVIGVEAGYANKQILFGVDFTVASGEVVALLGANGSGKSTALNTVSGFVRPWIGSIRLGGVELAGMPAHKIFRHGVIQVSQTRDLFPDMSVEENLRLGAWVRRGDEATLLDGIFGSVRRPGACFRRGDRRHHRRSQDARHQHDAGRAEHPAGARGRRPVSDPARRPRVAAP
jgi:ABC-type branched-subunit amino acid transport system ATPase component